MPEAGWSIRFYHANDYSENATIDFVSNFKNTKDRQLDSIITFSGMYGIDNYLIWNIHRDLPSYDFSTVALNLRLYLFKNTKIIYFQDFYRVRDIKYTPNKSQYTLYAISESTIRLHKRLIDYNVTSLSYSENRTAKQLLEEILMGNNIFYVYFHEDSDSTKEMIHYKYRYFDIEPEWTVLDLIEYIADDNKYEWLVTKAIDTSNKPYWILHIGHELKASKIMNATKDYNMERDSISHSLYSMKITTDGSPMEPLANWENELKCVWSKHTAGKGGGISRGCFVPTSMGYLDKYLYLRMLEGNIERHIGYSMLNRRKIRIPSIGIGNVLTDEGNEYVDEVSIQKNPKSYSIRDPLNIIVNRGDDLAVQHQIEKITRSSPYLDHEAGLLFPSPKLENPPPNSIIFNVDGKRESSVLGPYVYGNGREELKLPFKNKGDFRLQLPNKFCLYVTENGEFILQKEADYSSEPSGSGTYIKWNSNGEITIEGEGNIEVKTTGTVNIGQSASAVNIAGGSSFISKSTHTHQVTPGPAIPGPPATASPTSDNTTKTKAS